MVIIHCSSRKISTILALKSYSQALLLKYLHWHSKVDILKQLPRKVLLNLALF